MKAIIMAGGKGTSLMPISELAPKPMTRLLGIPLLEHLVLLLKENGFTELCLTLGHQPDSIMDYFGSGSGFGVSITYHIEEEPLGTAGGVRACSDFYRNEDFLVISGDAACDFQLKSFFEHHLASKSDVTMALYPHPQPLRYGTVVTDRFGKIVSFIEKPNWSRVVTDHVNTGVYVISPKAMELVPRDIPFDFARDLFPIMAQSNRKMTGLPMSGYWCDIGDGESYLRCCMDALEGKLKVRGASKDYYFGGRGVFRLENDVTVIAPSVICRGAEIGHGATIEHSIIHPRSRIGAFSRVQNSVVDGGNVGDASVIAGTVICRNCCVPAKSVTKNGEIISRTGEEYYTQPQQTESAPRGERGLCQELLCKNRASLMRQMSSVLWESGADFSDGISIKDGKCKVKIYPLEEESAILVEALGGRESDRLSACRKHSELAKKFGGVAKN